MEQSGTKLFVFSLSLSRFRRVFNQSVPGAGLLRKNSELRNLDLGNKLRIKRFFKSISEPKTAIVGGPDIHYKEGSTMNLTCVISDSPEPPTYIFWRHNDAVSITLLL